MNGKQVLITGGSGFLGSALTAYWLSQGLRVTVLSRDPTATAKLLGPQVRIVESLEVLGVDSEFAAIVNLAGAPIFGQRWSPARKLVLRNSRIAQTTALIKFIAELKLKPEVLINGSAIGVYGDQADTLLTETSQAKADFAQQLCADWETAALAAEKLGVRVCLIRTGLVLDRRGGLLQRMLPAYQLGLGGKLGNGRQWMSWIHRQDWVAIADFLLLNPQLHGAFNATAPQAVTNTDFSTALAKQLHRPALLNMPAWLLRGLLGEMSTLVLGSQRVQPARLQSAGFEFTYPSLTAAFRQIFAKS